MPRLLVFILILAANQTLLAVEEIPEFRVKVSSEKFFFEPWFPCGRYRVIRPRPPHNFRTITDLEEGCGLSLETTEAAKRVLVGTQHGVANVRFNTAREGPGVAATTQFNNEGGKLSAEARIVSIERPQTSLGMGLRVRLTNPENFETASAKVFDHHTGELLLSWSLGDEPGSQSIEFDDHFDRAFRYEYEFDGFLQGKRHGAFDTFLGISVPEPSSSLLALFGFLAVVALRKRCRCV